MDPDPEAIYLFCFARSALISAVEGNGVDGKSSLFVLTRGDIAAVASSLPREECGGYSSEEKMMDLAWVGLRAYRHEEVIERVMRRSPVLPVRLGTIFGSRQSLWGRMEEHCGTIGHFLDRVADKEEWSVKGLLNRSRAEEEYTGGLLSSQSERLSASPGTRYLQERQIRKKGAHELHCLVRERCEILAGELARIAEEMRERKVLSREAVGGGKEMILNWTFLVPRDAVRDFRTRIALANERFAAQGLVLEFSGPWPPYSFCPSL